VIEQAADVLRHSAFVEALESGTEGDSDWTAKNAGLVVLRLVDAWLTSAGDAPELSVWGMKGARSAIEAVSPSQVVRAILSGVVDSIEQTGGADARKLAPRLLAYGRCLDHDGHWKLAIDVYRTILGWQPPALDADMVIDAQMRLAHCYRVESRYDEAAIAYAAAKRVARSSGDQMKELHARVGEGTLAVARGNLPLAESILDEAIAASTLAGFGEVRSIALHGRAFVANARRHYEDAARFAYDALSATHSLTARDRILTDLALSLTQTGALDAARDAFLVVAATAQEQYVRWVAMVNLMEVGALQTNEPLFERYRRELAGESLPDSLRAQYYYYAAFGYHAFGKATAAEGSLADARAIAEHHAYNQLSFEIETLAGNVRHGIAAERRVSGNVERVRDIAAAVSEMRDLVGV